jgi:hypothetical protein
MQLGAGPWFHAFELRFLVSAGAYLPPKHKTLKKDEKAHLIQLPDGMFLAVNLIIGAAGIPLECPIPTEMSGGGMLWRRRLQDGRLAVLVGRVRELDDQNRENIRHMRQERRPTGTFLTMQTSPYLEIWHLHWSSQGGNVVLVIPMGEEAFRSEQDYPQAGAISNQPRHFHFRSPRSTVEFIAPDRRTVAVIELAEINKVIELTKNVPRAIELGLVSMRVEPGNLISGSNFTAPPQGLLFSFAVGEASHSWEYIIIAKFDGSCFTAELQRISTSLHNRNLAVPISALGANEKLIIAIPSPAIKLTASLDLPMASSELLGRFTLLVLLSQLIESVGRI